MLVLADGTVFHGVGMGAPGESSGEVVFNTGMSGYQEVFSDPSYCGQIVVMTSPHIGNVGTNPVDDEAARPRLAGVAVMAPSPYPSNYRASASLDEYLSSHGITGIAGIDQRALTRKIRTAGAMPGVVAWPVHGPDASRLADMAAGLDGMAGKDLVREVTCGEPYSHEPGARAAWLGGRMEHRGKAVVVDFGVKTSILDCVWAAGYDVEVVPARAGAGRVLDEGPDLVVLSNGPGDPEPVTYGVETAAGLVGKVPVLGICLGHQILALALGARTYKLKFGHHGCNHPVREEGGHRVLVTSQNHGFAVDPDTLPDGARVTFSSLNDATLEGFTVPDSRMFAVQFHPEAGPGPHDARFLFNRI